MSGRQKKTPGPVVSTVAPVADSNSKVIATARLSEMAITNPAPDASPSREPTGTYKIISFN